MPPRYQSFMPWREQLEAAMPDGLANDPWVESPHYWFRLLQIKIKGHVGEDMCLLHYPEGEARNGTGHDVEAGELLLESKISSRSFSGSNAHAWNQIRPLQNWTHLFLVAVELAEIRVFLVPKIAVYDPYGDAEIRLYGLHHGAEAFEQNDPSCQLKTNSSDPLPDNITQYEIVRDDWIEIFNECQPEVEDDEWFDSEFQWVRGLGLIARGTIGEMMYVDNIGGTRQLDKSLGYDIAHNDNRIEVKFSTRTYHGGNAYQWNQIRPDDDYTHLFLVGVDVDSVRAFFLKKNQARQLVNQHGGEADTQLLATRSNDPVPDWLSQFEVFP